MIATVIFCLCLLLAIWFTALILIRVYYKQNIGIQLPICAAAWTGVITNLMHIW